MKILNNRAFLFIWLGSAVSELGGAFGTFCNSVIVFELTGSKLAIGSMWLLYFIPSLVLQLFIGPFIDRWSRKWIMIFSQWTRGLIFLVPLFAIMFGSLEPWHVFAVQIVVGLITPFYVPANQALIPTIVPREQLDSANAYLDGMIRLMTLFAPILGGLVIEYIGVKITLIFVCGLLMASGTFLLKIQEPQSSQSIRKTWINQFLEGITYFFKSAMLVWLGIFLAFVQFGVGVTMVINLPYITEELQGSYAEYGYFMAGFPLGYMIGSILIGRVMYRSLRVVMLGALVIGGLTFILLALNRSTGFAIFIEMIGGISMAFFNVHNTTIFQRSVPNPLMGKVFSVRLFIIRGMMPLGVFTGGILSEQWGVRPAYFLIGSIICVVSLLGVFHPYFKFLDEGADDRDLAS